MAKFYGTIGYVHTEEVKPGVFKEVATERKYCGDIVRNTRHLESSAKVNDDINVSNEISIIADPFANGNLHSMRYVEFMGSKWKIYKVEVQYPRLVLTVGGVYNGKSTTTTS